MDDDMHTSWQTPGSSLFRLLGNGLFVGSQILSIVSKPWGCIVRG